MNMYHPAGIPADLVAWKRPEPASLVERAEPGPVGEAWLREWVGPYREARERQERMARGEG